MTFKRNNWRSSNARFFCGSCLLLLGCGAATPEPASTQAPPSEPAAGSKGANTEEQTAKSFDLEAMLNRETETLPTKDIVDPAGIWTAKVEATDLPNVSVDTEGNANVSVSIGAVAPMECVLYKEKKDIAATIAQMFELTAKGVTFHKIAPTFTGLAGNHPMLAVTGFYSVDQNGQKAGGLLKLAMYAHPARSALCYHDELGYVASFQRVAQGLFGSLVVKDAAEQSQYAEVWTTHLSGVPVGFTELNIYINQDGSRTSKYNGATIIPRTPDSLNVRDEYTITESGKNGQITKRKDVVAEGTEISVDLVLERVKKKKYSYKGTFKGKPIEGTFSTAKKTGLTDSVSVTARIKNLFKKTKDTTFEEEQYLAELDPTKPTATKYEVSGTQTPQTCLSHVGQLSMKGTAGKDGDLEQMVVPMGTFELVMKRVYARGEILDFK